MFKFFRKYNKYILAIGGSILMVLFLLPNLSSWTRPDSSKQVIGLLGERKIRVRDTRQADAEIGLLGALGLPVRVAQSKPSIHWLMMLEEARRQGLYGSRADVEQVLQAAGVTSQRVAQVKSQYNASDKAIMQAVGHWVMVNRLQQLAMNFRRLSEPQVRHTARDMQTRVKIKVLALPAEMLLGEIEPPTEEELLQRFNLNRADLPGNSKPYGFGYRLPDRVKLEYLHVPLDRIRQAIQLTDVEANAYYLEHPDQFLPEPSDPADEPATDKPQDKAGQAETPKPDPTKPLPYAQVRDKAFRLATDAQAQQMRDRILKWAANLLHEKQMPWKRDPATGYYDLSNNPPLYSFEQVAREVQNQFGVLPTAVRLDQWLGVQNELDQLPGIGQARLTLGSSQNRRDWSLRDYVSSARELNPPTAHPLLNLRLQVKVASRPMTSPSGDGFIFRLLDAQPSRPPRSLDEVRQQVLRDVKRLKAYGRLQDQAEQLLQAARRDGLETVADNRGKRYDRKLTVAEVDPFPRRYVDMYRTGAVVVPEIEGVGRSARFVDAVFEQLEKVIAAGGIEQAGPQAMTAIALDDKLTLYLVQITGYEQLSQEEFESFKPFTGLVLRQLDALSTYSSVNPFNFEALAQRVGYSEPTGRNGQSGQKEQTDRQPAQPGSTGPASS